MIKEYMDIYYTECSQKLHIRYWNFQSFIEDGVMCDSARQDYIAKCEAIKNTIRTLSSCLA